MMRNQHNLLLKSGFLMLLFPMSFVLNVLSFPLKTLASVELLISALATTAIMFFLMSFFQLFRAFRFYPRKSDFIIVSVLLFFTEILVQTCMTNWAGLPSRTWSVMIEMTLLISASWYLLHLSLAILLKAFGYHLNILFLGRPEELAKLDSTLKSSDYNEIFKFHLWSQESEMQTSDLVIYTPHCINDENFKYHLIQLSIANLKVMDVRDLVEDIENRVDLQNQNESDLLKWAQDLPVSSKFYLRLKSFLEPMVALFMLVLLSPIMLLTAMAVKVSSSGPILFKQRRLGIGGKTFDIFKFRTMKVDAEIQGAQWAQQNDPRITPIGNWLRILHLDELPQLLNIINGDISFVGPRPERPEFYDQLKKRIPLFYLRTVIRPGVTGWAQVWAGYAANVEESSLKLSYDLYYMKKMGLRMDVISVLLTFLHVVRKFFFAEKSLAEPITPDEIEARWGRLSTLGKRMLVVLLLTTIAMSVTSIAIS